MVINDGGLLLFVYKCLNGECWFEYTAQEKYQFSKFSYLANSVRIDSMQDEEECKMVMILDEANFIAKNIHNIVEPSMQIKAYLHQRKLLQAFNVINLVFELALVAKYALNHDAMLLNYQAFALKQGWSGDAFAFGAVVCTCMVYNIITLVFGIYAI
jgi:hypothetical protein